MRSDTILNYINNSRNQEKSSVESLLEFWNMESKIKSSCKIQCVYLQVVMLNPVCDWICEEVLYTDLILATFKKHKFICDQAINPKISLVLLQVVVPYFKAVCQTQVKSYISLKSKNQMCI